MKIGDHVHIGAGSVVEAATIGNHVEIGKNCIIVCLPLALLPRKDKAESFFFYLALSQGKFAIIKDCAKIADNTVLAPNTVVPALSLFAGSPGKTTFSVFGFH
jgi:dynactin-5